MPARITTHVEGSTLAWAREEAGYPTIDAAAAHIHYLQKRKNGKEYLEKLENEKEEPTVAACKKLAHAYMVEYTLFYLPQEQAKEAIPDLSGIKDFRSTTKNKLAKNTIRYLREIVRRQLWLKEFLIDEDCEKVSWLGKSRDEDVKETARKLREKIWQSAQPTRNWKLESWIEKIEDNLGIYVMRSSPPSHHYNVEPDFSGCALHDRDLCAPVVALNSADSKEHQLFTLAHELAHLAIGQPGISRVDFRINASDIIERRCNNVAAEILMPENEFRKEWKESGLSSSMPDDERVKWIAKRFSVSFSAAAVQALKCGLIPPELTSVLLGSENSDHREGLGSGTPIRSGRSIPEHIKAYRRTGPRLARRALMAYNERYVSALDLWDLFQVKLDHLPKIAEKVDVDLIYWR